MHIVCAIAKLNIGYWVKQICQEVRRFRWRMTTVSVNEQSIEAKWPIGTNIITPKKLHDHFYRYTRQCMQRIAFASYMHLPVSFSFRNFLTPQSQLLNTLRCLHNFYGPVASHVSARKKVNHKKFRGFICTGKCKRHGYILFNRRCRQSVFSKMVLKY